MIGKKYYKLTVIKADNYDDIEAGTYEGFITFSIDVRNQ